MKKLVPDASVAIKWFIPEVHSPAAARLLDEQFYLSAPDLIVPELGNTLWKKVRRDEITAHEATEIMDAFESVPVEIHPSTVLLRAALDLALALDRSVYDSLYLALAIAQNGRLITADRKFHSVVSASAFAPQIRWIEDEL